MDGTTENNYLGTVDLIVFGGAIAAAVAVGIYYAIVDRKKNADNYYFAGKMSPIPVGLSLAVSAVSAITTIAFASETYAFGVITIWFAVINIIPTSVACIYYIPMIQRLQLKSINMYLEQRFHVGLRLLNSGISILLSMIFLGITVYTPSLALNAITPLSLLWTIVLTTLICTFYTTLGGMKGVIWTDSLQSLVMLAGGLAALIRTVILVGGFGNIYHTVEKGGRWNAINIDPDPTLRYTMWTFLFGTTLQGCRSTCVNQTATMRYILCRTVKNARIAAILSLVPSFFLMGIAVISGAAMYTYYEGCDPLLSNKITKADQMFPYLVVDIFQDTPGVAGLYVAAAFSATLSSVSSGITASASLIMQDFIIVKIPSMSEFARLVISKLLVFLFGILVMGTALIISVLDATVFRVGISLIGAFGGPVFAVFTLGAFLPWTNAKGAAFGQVLGTIFLVWVSIASLLTGKSNPANRPLPVSIDECPAFGNQSQAIMDNTTMYSSGDSSTYFPTTVSLNDDDDFFKRNTIETTLYALSNNYYPLLAMLITIPSGLIVSFLTGANDPSKANPKLFIPLVDNRLLPKKVKKFFRFGVPTLEENKDSISLTEDEENLQSKNAIMAKMNGVETKL